MKSPVQILRSAAALAGFVLTPRCRDVTRLLSEQRERPLPWLLRKRLAWHLAICNLCQRYGEQIALLPALLRGYAEDYRSGGKDGLGAERKRQIKEAMRHDT